MNRITTHPSPGVDELLDNAPCGFLSFADDGTVQLVNQTLLDLLGYERTAVVGRHVEHLLTVGTRIFYQTHWFPLLRLHGRAHEIFLMMRTSSGASLGVLSYAQHRAAASAYDCVFVEVKERAKYEEELLQARRKAEAAATELERQKREVESANATLETQAVELEMQQEMLREQAEQLQELAQKADQANKAKSSFLAHMSHELRTPLNAIGGYLQILELGISGPLTDRQREIITRLDRSSRHLLGLINDVLDLSRIEAGGVTFDIQNVRLADAVSAVTPLVEPQLAAKQITFEVSVSPELMVHVDEDKLRQIIVNLLGNAAKFTPAGGRVRLSAREEDDCAVLLLEDTGIGIPADQLESIFRPFVQAEAGHSNIEGSGLGLAISRDLARGMRGDLSATSIPGQGSTFLLRLPGAQPS